MELKKLYLKFESNDGSSIVIHSKGIENLAEDHLSQYITKSLEKEDPIRVAFKKSDITVQVSSARRKLRSLQETEAIVEIGGSITFDEKGAPDASLVEDLQEKAFAESWIQSDLKGVVSSDSTVTVLNELPTIAEEKKPVDDEKETLGGGGNKTGGTVGGVVGAFAFVGVAAFAFMQYKKRKTDDKGNASYHAREVFVQVGSEYGHDGDEQLEAVMSPTFSVQESAASSINSVRKGYTMPLGSRVKSFTFKKNTMSVGGDYDDTYSLDGSTALGHNPNLGDKMLNQVLAMSSYTPDSDVTCLNDGTTPGRPRTVHVAPKMTSALGDEESVFTYSSDYGFDSPSVFGGMSVSGNSMVSESIRSHGRSLTIGEKRSFNARDNNVGGDQLDDESSADGIEVAIDRLSEADSESVFSEIDGIDSSDVPVPASRPTQAKAAAKKSFTPTKTLNFAPRSKEDFKVNIVETENAKKPTSKPTPATIKMEEPVASKKSLIPWSSRQVQRVEQNHKVTITTEPSAPTWVKSNYPIQAAQKALADDSSHGDDSYSSYFSSDNEEEVVSKLLRAAKEGSRQTNNRTQQKLKSNAPAAKRNVVSNSVNFPIRSPRPVQHHQVIPSLSPSAKSTGSPTLSTFEKELKTKGISTTNYAAEVRKTRMARRSTKDDNPREESGKESISNQVASLRRARLQQRRK